MHSFGTSTCRLQKSTRSHAITYSKPGTFELKFFQMIGFFRLFLHFLFSIHTNYEVFTVFTLAKWKRKNFPLTIYGVGLLKLDCTHQSSEEMKIAHTVCLLHKLLFFYMRLFCFENVNLVENNEKKCFVNRKKTKLHNWKT